MSEKAWLTFLLALFTLVAFAANSILCRLALVTHAIGELQFTLVRLLSGALILLPIIVLPKSSNYRLQASPKRELLAFRAANILPAMALFGYALCFSLAYTQLTTGTGALILFASVQITMVGMSILQGNRLTGIEWLGFLFAFGGLVYLIMPGLSAPPLWGGMMMFVSGFSWGAYSLLGKGQKSPVLSTARNFLFSVPGGVLLLVIIVWRSDGTTLLPTSRGLVLAVLSGAIASGLGYVLWYLTLKRITTTIASIVQLAVPVLAGLGGILFLGENMSLRLVVAAVFIMGGIAATILGRRRTAQMAT